MSLDIYKHIYSECRQIEDIDIIEIVNICEEMSKTCNDSVIILLVKKLQKQINKSEFLKNFSIEEPYEDGCGVKEYCRPKISNARLYILNMKPTEVDTKKIKQLARDLCITIRFFDFTHT